MSKKTTSCLALFILGLVGISGSLNLLKKDIDIDLSKSKQITGIVTYVDTREIVNGGLRYQTFNRVFYFTLKNSNEDFAIHRSNEGYEDLKANIQIGDTLKVYYREGSSDYNTHVFQVEKDGKIIEDYKEYNKNVSSKAGTVLFIGLLMAVASIVWYFNLTKFLTNWIEG